MKWLDRLHDDLLSLVRESGYRSLSMPTLCTGGIGVPVQFVAVAAIRSVYRDFIAHPQEPLRVRICCFEASHLLMARAPWPLPTRRAWWCLRAPRPLRRWWRSTASTGPSAPRTC